jgi:hypothetical protein
MYSMDEVKNKFEEKQKIAELITRLYKNQGDKITDEVKNNIADYTNTIIDKKWSMTNIESGIKSLYEVELKRISLPILLEAIRSRNQITTSTNTWRHNTIEEEEEISQQFAFTNELKKQYGKQWLKHLDWSKFRFDKTKNLRDYHFAKDAKAQIKSLLGDLDNDMFDRND